VSVNRRRVVSDVENSIRAEDVERGVQSLQGVWSAIAAVAPSQAILQLPASSGSKQRSVLCMRLGQTARTLRGRNDPCSNSQTTPPEKLFGK
jgi:hypothetical protein